MKKLNLLSWKWLLWSGWIVIALCLASLMYYIATGAFDGVDGGFGFAAAIGYIIAGSIVMGVLHLIAKLTSKHPKVSRGILIAVLVIIVLSLVLIVFSSVKSAQEDSRQESVRVALESCTVRSVAWTYEPQSTIIEYTDREPYVMDGYVQPTQVKSMVRERESICGHQIHTTINGEPIRRFY